MRQMTYGHGLDLLTIFTTLIIPFSVQVVPILGTHTIMPNLKIS